MSSIKKYLKTYFQGTQAEVNKFATEEMRNAIISSDKGEKSRYKNLNSLLLLEGAVLVPLCRLVLPDCVDHYVVGVIGADLATRIIPYVAECIKERSMIQSSENPGLIGRIRELYSAIKPNL